MLHRHSALALAVSLIAFLSSGGAAAQPRTDVAGHTGVAAISESGPDYSVSFSDDPLEALVGTGVVPRITLRLRGQRTLLIRARTSFVTEMLKSVERM